MQRRHPRGLNIDECGANSAADTSAYMCRLALHAAQGYLFGVVQLRSKVPCSSQFVSPVRLTDNIAATSSDVYVCAAHTNP
jgi:hypothetical protein